MTGEYELFREIWAERERECVVCGTPIKLFDVRCFAHILGKGAYPAFRLFKKNIEIMCYSDHHLFDHHTDKAKKDERFNHIFKKQEQLKQQYHEQ